MRGVSKVIEAVLILIITASIITLTYQWSFEYSSATQEKIEKNLAQKGCLKIENIDVINKKITVRNCGDNELGNFVIYLDSEQIATYSGTLNAGGITQINYNRDINLGNHEIFVSSNYAETPKIIFSISLPPLPCNYPSFGNWNIFTDIVCYNQVIVINGNITIQNGGNLTFYNVTLKLNSTRDFEYGIDVLNGGKMFIYDNDNQKTTSNDASNITNGPYSLSSHYFFEVEAGSQFEIKNSFISECGNDWPYPGMSIYADNSVIMNNTFDNNFRAIQIRDAKNCLVSNNIIKNSPAYGILIVDYSGANQNNIISDNTLINNDHNIHTCNGAKNNTISRNSITGGTYGIYSHNGGGGPPLYNNYAFNNISSATYGIYIIEGSHDNLFANSSVTNSGQNDYYLANATSTNNFTDMNFTANRKIYFNDSVSWFNYNNETTGNIWLKTSVSTQAMITRKLLNWNQSLIKWNDTSDTAVTARYNITGLTPSTSYNVYNGSVLAYTLPSGSSGQINFTINLPVGQEREIKVEKSTGLCQVFIDFLPYNITQNNTYYCLNTNSINLTKTAIQFGNSSSWPIQNSTLDCQGYKLDGNDTSQTGIYMSRSKSNTVKNCNITDFQRGIYAEYTNNSNFINSILNSNYQGVNLWDSYYNDFTNITVNYNQDGIAIDKGNYNNFTDITASYNSNDGMYFDSATNNIIKLTTANYNYAGFELTGAASSNLFNDTTANENEYGFWLNWAVNNNITNITARNNSRSLYLLSASGNNIDKGFLLNSTYTVYLEGSSTKNNTVKNLNIITYSDWGAIYLGNGLNLVGPSNNIINNNNITGVGDDFAIWLVNSSNNTINNNMLNSNYYGIWLEWSSNNTINNNTVRWSSDDGIWIYRYSNNNILTNNTVNETDDEGIVVSDNSNNNILTDNKAYNNNIMGFTIRSSYNVLTNNIAIGHGGEGFILISNYNTLINSTSKNNGYGIGISGSSYNNITGGSVFNNTNTYWESNPSDYYLISSGTTNNFTNTNFTATRTIYFVDAGSWFNYRNSTTDSAWLKTGVSATSTITRKLLNWNQTLIKWNDTSSTLITARYNITGLLPNTNYNVFDNNNLIIGSPFNSSSNGQINFTVNLPQNQEHEIRIALACNPPSSGDWFINDKTICNCLPGTNITVNGNVKVYGNAGLTLNNCLLWIKQTYDFQYEFRVNDTATSNLTNSVLDSSYSYATYFEGNSRNNLTNTIFNPPSTSSYIYFAENSQNIITNITTKTCTYFTENSANKVMNSSFTSDCNTDFDGQTKTNITNSYVRHFLIFSDVNHNLTAKDLTYGNPVSNYIKASGSNYEVNWTNLNIVFISFVAGYYSNNTVINLKSNAYFYLYDYSKNYVYNSSFSSFDSSLYSNAFLYTKNTTFSHPVNFYEFSTANITNSSLTDNITFYDKNSVFFDSSKTVDWNVKSSSNSTIRGNLTINGKLKWDAGGKVTRYFPVIVTNSSGSPVSSASVNVTNLVSGQVIWQGLTDGSGYAEANNITFNSSNYGIGNFSINISKSGKVNSTIIGFLTNTSILLRLI